LPETLNQAIHRLALKYHQDENLIKRIIKCEGSLYEKSWQTPHQNHDTWRSLDWGPLQINDHYHQAKMRAMGLNIYKWEDSLAYGIGVLLVEQGTAPWSASAFCWQQKTAL